MRTSVSVSIVLLGFLLFSESVGQVLWNHDAWLGSLYKNIDDIREQVQHNVQNIREKIQTNLDQQLAVIKELEQNNTKEYINSPQNQILISNGTSLQIISSGVTTNGERFHRKVYENISGNILRHVEEVYNAETKTKRKYGYTIDLADTNAKPIPIPENEIAK